jgi:hypothetical protein
MGIIDSNNRFFHRNPYHLIKIDSNSRDFFVIFLKKMAAQGINTSLSVSYLALQKRIGSLGVLLPFILWFGNILVHKIGIFSPKNFVSFTNPEAYKVDNYLKSSISHFFYTPMSEVFTGILSALALFLFSYKGDKSASENKLLSQNCLSNVAAFCALGVVLFPTGSEEIITDNIRSYISSESVGLLHFAFAGLFFIALALMSLLHFSKNTSVAKARFHKTAGWSMLACLLLIFLVNRYDWFMHLKPVFWLESLALWFFGFSWLTRGELDLAAVLHKFTKNA